ncbi:c-type cytochrome [Yoonia algicola]|uniref:Cytochrome c n=1 Tax=Yoonia algicola TaxID=3137368 RepID=A0AAN0NI72_9RHOB
MPKNLNRVVVAAIAFGIAGAAFAAGHLTEDQQRAMDARQSHMGLYSFNLAPIGAMAQDKIPYDEAVAASAAANLAALASIDQSAYWVEGTDASIEGSRAKTEIWTDAAGYLAEKEKLAAASAALAAVAGDGLDAMKAAFSPVGQSCGSCHEAYRAPRT